MIIYNIYYGDVNYKYHNIVINYKIYDLNWTSCTLTMNLMVLLPSRLMEPNKWSNSEYRNIMYHYIITISLYIIQWC